jgi:TPP-dependent pyruvate/acetoin dehydrogenase alpha subunit
MAYKIKQAAEAVSTGGSLISDAKLKQLYTTMLQCRLLTERARRAHNRNGSSALYAASVGQEAIATGCAIDLRPEDTIASHESITSRVIARLVKRVPLNATVAELYANHLPSIATEAQLSAATSLALANKREKNTAVVVGFTGKAVTALGAWHETLALSAAQSLPVIFVVENNSRVKSAGVRSDWEDFTQKAQSYGLAGITVDGNDVVAVYRVAHESLERVRQGDGPVLIEATAYRQTDQTGRSEPDPLTHMERYLAAKKLFHPRWKNRLVEKFSQELDDAAKAARKMQRPQRQQPNARALG